MIDKRITLGHIAAIITIFLWGTTFVSTKVLLKNFEPIEILFFRFIMGYIALVIINPKRIKINSYKEELYFVGAGLCGVTLYFLFENIALKFSLASNIGVLVSVAPFATAILAHFFIEGEKLNIQFFFGFLVAMAGIILMAYNGNSVLKLNPIGDLLAILAAIVWGIYSILLNKIGRLKYDSIACTRRIFFYGIITMIPTFPIFNFKLGLNRFTDISSLLNIIYLGLGASAMCFVLWTWTQNVLGVMKANVYIYLIPAITMVASSVVLKEKITSFAIVGTALILIGLLLSEGKIKFKKPIDIDVT